MESSHQGQPMPGHTHHAADGGIDAVTQAFAIETPTSLRSKSRLFAIIFALCLCMFTVALNQTIVATAVPAISRDLHSASGYSWVGSAYLLANAAACTLWTRASDIWGRKAILLITVGLFFVASILAAVSKNMTMLIAARALQGAGGGGITQMVIITISDLFSLRQRSLFVGLIEVIWTLAGGVGPLLGGVFAQYVNWRWCFYINLPITGLSFVMLLATLDVHNPRTRIREGLLAIDWLGTICVLGMVLMILLGLDFGGVIASWNSATVVCLLVFGVVMVACFLYVERRWAKYPLMPLELFKDWQNIAVTLVLITHGMAYIAADYYLPLYLQSVKQASPLRSGVLILPLTITSAAIGALTGVVIHHTGRYRELIWVGAFGTLLGTALFILMGPKTPIVQVIVFQVIAGVGLGPLFQAPIIAIQAVASQADTAAATSTFGFLRNVATSVSLVIGSVIFQNGMNDQMNFMAAAGIDEATIVALSGGHAAANVDVVRHIDDQAQRETIQAAFASSMRNMWIAYASIAAVGALASLFVAQSFLSSEHTETRTGIMSMKTEARD